ncbi:hypothetical protein [Terricaulis sp.]|uniref:hypothetical protein n=1 Tax=Terricaulis sp. TaxID=2768686 RepID=UPI003784ADF9
MMAELNDHELADLLGEPPRTPDPGFRVDVFARITEAARRRAALQRAFRQVGAFALIGLVIAAAQTFGLTWDAAQPVVIAAVFVGAAYLFAHLTMAGPGAVLGRSRAALRGRF